MIDWAKPVRVLSKKRLREFWEKHVDSEGALCAWHQEALAASWSGPSDIKQRYAHASFVGDRVVFNIGGNKYRLVVGINYPAQIVFVKLVGTHAEYDRIDVEEV